MKKKLLPITILLLPLSLGCLCIPTGLIKPSRPPTTQKQPTSIASPVIETPIMDELSLVSPWLLIETETGLWAANADGSGLSQLTDIDYWDGNLQRAVQPGGNQVVYLTPANEDDFHDMALNLLSIPDLTITPITKLTSPETEAYAELDPVDDNFQGLLAIRSPTSYAWSPDGTRLAFVGLLDGPTAEIYIYDTTSGTIQRVSNDTGQNYSPSWSPDGNSLLYFTTDSPGISYSTTSVWLADRDGTGSSMLYMPESNNERLAGWLNARSAVLTTWYPAAGYETVRLLDVDTKEMITLEDGWIISAQADSTLGAAMYATYEGLYLVSTENLTPQLVSLEEVERIHPVGLGDSVFTVAHTSGSLATYGTEEILYQVSPLTVTPGYLEVAMAGLIWAWTSEAEDQPGVWITGPGIEIGQIYTGSSRLPIWDGDSNLIFFSLLEGYGYELHRTTFDAYYQDLGTLGSVPGSVNAVTWLGVP